VTALTTSTTITLATTTTTNSTTAMPTAVTSQDGHMQGCALALVLALYVMVQLRAQHRHVLLASLQDKSNRRAG
jgi:hypothetical protein